MLSSLLAQVNQDVIGEVGPPPGVDRFQSQVAADEIGILIFFSNIFRVATIVAGIWVMFNFLLAGYQYITAQGDSSAHQKVRDRITFSVIGLVVIISAYTAVALLGLLFFGEANYFLQPTLIGPDGAP